MSPDPALPSDVHTRAELAAQLTLLRTRAGLSVRALARAADLPTATVGDYFSGRHLPGVSQVPAFEALLRLCGVPDSELPGWLEAVQRIRRDSDRRRSRPDAPYRGLEPFTAADAELFFGREAVTAELVARVRSRRGGEAVAGAVSLVLVGPSGSGKSSLLRAGVAASVSRTSGGESWSVAALVPGEDPAQALRTAAGELGPSPARSLLIVDQLEEIFGVAEPQRTRFLAELTGMRSAGVVVLAALRADFYAAALAEPALLGGLSAAQMVLGPMTRAEIRSAIVQPARRVGARVDPGLVELLLTELAPEPGAGTGGLPLLSHALRAAWEQGSGDELTTADYRAAGGLHGAISQTAEQLYTDLEPAQREVAQRIFGRLVRIVDDGPAIRRTAARHELTGADGEDGDTAAVLQRFVAARLLTADADSVSLSHEALITAWPRLTAWIDTDRDGLRRHHQLAEAAREWTAAGGDPALLLRGTRLVAAEEWAGEPGREATLTGDERRFLEASAERAAAARQAARGRARRMRRLAGLACALGIVALGLAAIALHARHVADLARDQALSREVAVEAGSLTRSDPGLAMQLALTGYRIAPTVQATSALLDASAGPMPAQVLGADGPTAEATDRSGRLLAVADSATDRVILYRMAGPAPPRPIAAVSPDISGQQLYAVALSPDGRRLAAAGTAGPIAVWSLADPAHPVRAATLRGFDGTVDAVAFSSGAGDTLAGAGADGDVRRWTLAARRQPAALPVLVAPGHASLSAVAYAPGGRTLTAVGADGRVVTWQAHGSRHPQSTFTVGATTLDAVAYGPGGHRLAAGAQNTHVYVWRVDRDGTVAPAPRVTLGGFTSYVDSIAFGTQDRELAAGDSDSTVRVWSTTGWRHLDTLGDLAPVTGVRFSPDGRQLITADEDGTVRVDPLPPEAEIQAPASVFSVDYDDAGRLLAAISGGPGGDAELWDSADPWQPRHLATVELGPSFGPVWGVGALSPNGQLLAVGDERADVRLLDVDDPTHPRVVGPLLAGAGTGGRIEQIAFSPDGRLLDVANGAGVTHVVDVADPAHPVALPEVNAAGAGGAVLGIAAADGGRQLAEAFDDDRVRLWDVADARHARREATLDGFAASAYTVAYTPDGRTLIAGSADDTIRLWDVADPSRPRPLGRPLTAAQSTIYDVAVNPQATMLAAATSGHGVLLWNIRDLARPRLIADLTALGGDLYDVTFSPHGSTLAVSGATGAVRFFDDGPGQVAARICRLAGAPITRTEWDRYVPGAAYRPPCERGRVSA